MLEKCTYISAVCEVGAPGAQLQAYKEIIDLADVVLCVYDTDIPATSSAEDRALAYPDADERGRGSRPVPRGYGALLHGHF